MLPFRSVHKDRKIAVYILMSYFIFRSICLPTHPSERREIYIAATFTRYNEKAWPLAAIGHFCLL
jgi:hypothetical protein